MLSLTALVLTLLALGVAYGYYKFNTRVSPTIPYAGSPTATRDPTLSERLRAPQEYAKDPVEYLCKTRSILGDLFCVDLLAVKIVFALGPEGNKEVFRASEEKLSMEDAVTWSMGPIVSHLFDSEWSVPSNRILRIALLRQEKLDGYYAMCSRITEGYFAEFAKKDSVPLFKSISHIVIALLLMLFAGEETYIRYGEELIPMMVQFERDLQEPILRVTPWAFWRFTKPGKALFATCERFEKVIRADVDDILVNPEKHAERDDYLYFIVSELGERFANRYGRHIMTIIFAGHANAAMTIPWLFLHARRVPGALDKIRAEAVLPQGERRPYLEACMRETGRLYTNTLNMRMTREDMQIAGHLVPKGTLVAASPLALQRVDGAFERAGQWDPMHFLASEGGDEDAEDFDTVTRTYAKFHQRGELIQFGMGQHACPGEKMARMFMYDLILKTWMERYDVEVVGGLEEGVKGIDGVGAEAAWTEENFGTPGVRGEDVSISVRERPTPAA